MKKGETYTGRVQHVDFPNKAVVFTESENPEDNGQKVIVKNSIPGQKVRFMVNKKRGGKCEGRLLQVLENAPSETADRCKHFGTNFRMCALKFVKGTLWIWPTRFEAV